MSRGSGSSRSPETESLSGYWVTYICAYGHEPYAGHW
jgi:hypothetical protein